MKLLLEREGVSPDRLDNFGYTPFISCSKFEYQHRKATQGPNGYNPTMIQALEGTASFRAS